MASATKESAIAKRLRKSTKPNAAAASTAATMSASRGAISPAASGRARVRSTCGSYSRSA
jgi:hypothetical protein